jgi:hypothetical protein
MTILPLLNTHRPPELCDSPDQATHYHISEGYFIKVKLSLKQAVEAHRIVRRRGSHIFYTIGSQMAVRSAFYPQEDSWYSFLLEAESTPGS